MAKSKKSKQSAKDKEKKAAAKAKAKAAALVAALSAEAKKARKTADKAVKAAEKAQAKAVAAGAPAPKAQASEADLLKLALRSTEAKLTDAERRVEALEQQVADFHRRDELEVEDAIEETIVDAAVAATVEEAVVEAEVAVAAGLTADPVTVEAVEAEVVAEELDEIVAEAAAPTEPSHEGEAAAAAEVFATGPVPADDLTPPLPAEPAADEPNASWTLVRLRAEAKTRGLAGTSNLPKAALLERLTNA